MDDLRKPLGAKITYLAIASRTFEMREYTPRMANELFEYTRREAVKAFMKTARECDLPFDQIKWQLTEMNNADNINKFDTPLSTAYALYLRARHAGVTLEECIDLPLIELDRNAAAIFGADDEPETEGDQKKT